MLHRTRSYFVEGASDNLRPASFISWKALIYIIVRMPQLFLILLKIKKQPFSGKRWKKRKTLRPLVAQWERGNKTAFALGWVNPSSPHPTPTKISLFHNSTVCWSCSPHWLCFLPSVKFLLPIQFQIELPPTFSYSDPEEMENSWPPSSTW